MKPTSAMELIATFATNMLVEVLREPARPRELSEAEIDQLEAEHDAEVDRLDRQVAAWNR